MKYRTIVKKDLPYLPLFKSDWLSSKKVRRCCAATRGVYADLLCVLHDEERHGCYSLHLQEEKWRKSRSKTNLALSKPDGYQRLPYFAEFLSRRIGDTKNVILKALKELYERKIIVVEGDSLIQPRMYMDSEYELLPETVEWLAQSEDHEIVMEPVTDGDSDDVEDGVGKGGKKTSKKTIKKKNEKSRTRTDAYATRTESESENKNINNDSIGNIGGVGDFETPVNRGTAIKQGADQKDNPKQSPKPKTKKITSDDTGSPTTVDGKPVGEQDDGGPTFGDFWELYDKKVNMIDAEAYWGVLSRQDREDIMEYLPRYKIAQPRKQFRKNPVTFLRMKAWKDEIIQDNEIRNDETANRHNSGNQSQRAEARDRDILEQSQRILERKLRKNGGDTE